ncbi:MAG: bifunctional non-ous end joining protein LigD [Myxococcales bacterium]|nr:bifunctional non-ous end joining protein LigD [Myxococcales bacterium]
MKRTHNDTSRSAAARSLERYNAMRDFDTTEEPSGRVRPTESGHSFVIQKHAATALHYDFRLELDGVLLSWAVPKGPSLSPKDKRLAVQTEDHPVDYRDFEGTIPHGEYGGGPVIVWDRGTWEPIGDPREGLKRGRLEFVLHGEKLHGKYMLVRLAEKDRDRGKKNWLLIKRGDEHVREGKDAEIVKLLPKSVLTDRTVEEVKAGVPANAKKSPKATAKKAASKASAKKAMAKTKTKTKGAPLPAFGKIQPQLATLVDDVPTHGDWVYELKYDGYRAIATLDDGEVRIASRNGKDWTDHFPTIAEALSHVRARTAVFDGEIAYVMEDGRTDFQKLQNALSGAADAGRLVYFVFDLLHYDGVDLTGEPLEARKDKLRTILAGEGPPLKLGDHVQGNGPEFFAQACKMGLEGIIAKRADKPYRAGRGPDWVKVKCQKRQEMVIVGSTAPKGKRTGIGALLLAVRDGKTYRYAGKVGTGFSHASLDDLTKRLAKIEVKEPPVVGAPRMRDARWVKPELVAQVRFTEWTRDGSLRHPTFEGLREDKKPANVVREVEAPVEPVERAAAKPATKTKTEAKATKTKAKTKAETSTRDDDDGGEVKVGKLVITHPERVVDKESGITKGDLARYAGVMAPLLLPFAKKRPLMLVRCTDAWDGGGFGSQGKRPKRAACFVQKHAGRGLVANIGRGEVDGEEVLYVTKEDEIVSLVQFNTVELHGWGSRMPSYDKPDWIVFDLDPDVGLPFARVVEAAIDLRDELAKMGLVTFVKTTGGKGLHVVVPLTPKDDWDVVSSFATAVAEGMVKREPKKYVATMAKAARSGKIFVDHFRNGRGATAILPYSPRARTGAAVALPITWKELPTIDPQAFTVRTVPELLAKRRVDPWADLLTTKQMIPRDLAAALRKR